MLEIVLWSPVLSTIPFPKILFKDLPVQILESLFLMKLSVKWKRFYIHERKKIGQPPDTINAVAKNNSSSRVIFQKVVQVIILFISSTVEDGF